RATDVWKFAAIRSAGSSSSDDGCDPGEEFLPYGTVAGGHTRRVVQSAQSRHLQRTGVHVRGCGFRRGLECEIAAHRTIGGPAELLKRRSRRMFRRPYMPYSTLKR